MGKYEFTNDQKRAIKHREGNLQLIACAGSGKTEVLARRVVELLDPDKTPSYGPGNIIAFTFTEKAAAELKQRVVERVTRQVRSCLQHGQHQRGNAHGHRVPLAGEAVCRSAVRARGCLNALYQ